VTEMSARSRGPARRLPAGERDGGRESMVWATLCAAEEAIAQLTESLLAEVFAAAGEEYRRTRRSRVASYGMARCVWLGAWAAEERSRTYRVSGHASMAAGRCAVLAARSCNAPGGFLHLNENLRHRRALGE
jgi:hypothetical protein